MIYFIPFLNNPFCKYKIWTECAEKALLYNKAVMSENYAIGEFLHPMKCMLAYPLMSQPRSRRSWAKFIFRRDTKLSLWPFPGYFLLWSMSLCNGRYLDVNSNSNAAAAAANILVMWR